MADNASASGERALYERRSGALSFKGRGKNLKEEKKLARKREQRKRTAYERASAADEADGVAEGTQSVGAAEYGSSGARKRVKTEDERDRTSRQVVVAEEIEGSGRIVSSGCTVQGFETKFQEEVEAGDVLLVKNPQTLQVQEVIVAQVLTNRSLTVALPFASDLLSTSVYAIRKEAKKLRQQQAKRKHQQRSSGNGDAAGAPAKEGSDSEEDSAAVQAALAKRLQKKLQKAARVVSVREKTGMWGYKITTRKVDHELTAEERLDERCKQGRDKYCW